MFNITSQPDANRGQPPQVKRLHSKTVAWTILLVRPFLPISRTRIRQPGMQTAARGLVYLTV